MRALSASLLAAQKAASGVPLLRAVVSNTIRSLKHLTWAEVFSDANADEPHAAAGDSTFVHRIKVNGSGQPQYEQGTGAGWQAIAPPITTASVCAIAAVNNTRVVLVWNEGAAIYYQESTDQGASFGGRTLVASLGATPKAVAVAHRNASGDLAIFWEESNAVKRIRRTSGAFGSVATWTLSAASINGLAVAYNADFYLVVTGTETTTLRPTLWTCILGDGALVSSDTWQALRVQGQAETDENVTFQAPSVAVIDTVRITFVEKFAGTNAYTRTYWTCTTALAVFNAGNWELLDPAPLDNTTAHGYAITKRGSAPSTAVLSRPAQVLESATAPVTLDMSADLIEATIEERDGITQRAELVFDNAQGQYAGPPAPVALHRDVALGLGYDGAYSSPPAQSIVGWEYRRRGGRSLFVLHLRGVDYWLELSRPRTTIVDTRPFTLIGRATAARAGIDFLASGNSARARSLSLEWTLHPDESQLGVLRRLLDLYADTLYTTSGLVLTLTEPLAGDSIDYTFGTDHAIYALDHRNEQLAGAAEVFGPSLLGQAFDHVAINNDRPLSDRRRDPHDATGTDVSNAAAARLRKAVLESDRGSLVVPPHVGLEVGDVLAYSDPHVHASQRTARVRSITTRFRRRDGLPVVYEQRIGLGGV